MSEIEDVPEARELDITVPDFIDRTQVRQVCADVRYGAYVLTHVLFSIDTLKQPRHFLTTDSDGDRIRIVTVPLESGVSSSRSIFIAVNRDHSIDNPGMPRLQELTMQGYLADLATKRAAVSKTAVAQHYIGKQTTWRPVVGKIGPFIARHDEGFKVTHMPEDFTGIPTVGNSIIDAHDSERVMHNLLSVLALVHEVDVVEEPIDVSLVKQQLA